MGTGGIDLGFSPFLARGFRVTGGFGSFAGLRVSFLAFGAFGAFCLALGGFIPRNVAGFGCFAFLRFSRSFSALTTETRLPVRLSIA